MVQYDLSRMSEFKGGSRADSSECRCYFRSHGVSVEVERGERRNDFKKITRWFQFEGHLMNHLVRMLVIMD